MGRRCLLLLIPVIAIGAADPGLCPGAQPAWTVPGQAEDAGYGFRVLFEKESLYHYIRVVEAGGVRRLQFERSGSEYEESAVNVADPLHFEMYYYSLLFAGFAHRDDPQRILLIGLGGGTVSMAIRHYFPKAQIDNVELDPDVVEVARKYFGFKEDDCMKVYVRDGRVQVRRFLREPKKYDVILVDAFRGGYIPHHLTTREFIQSLKALLTPGGVVVSNLRPGFESYHYHRRTFDAVFRNQYSYGTGGNVAVVVGMAEKRRTREELLAAARRLQETRELAFDLVLIIEGGTDQDDYVREGPILSDDYAPTDVLRGIPRDAR